MSTDPQQPIELPLSWVDVDEHAVLLANQFLVQTVAPNEFVVTVGQLVGPALIGSPEEQQEQAAEISFVPVKPVVRLNMTRNRVVELIQVLSLQVERHDAATQGMNSLGGNGQ
jgi:hypothetical protein